MTRKELYRTLVRAGWAEVASRGSHGKMKKGDVTIIVPYHTTELAKGTEKAIIKRAGLE